MAGTIDQRGENSWRIRLRVNGERHQRTVRGTKDDARRALLELELDLLNDRDAGPHETVYDVAVRWLGGHKPNLSPGVADDYERVIRSYLSTDFGQRDVATVVEGDVDAFYRELTAGGLGPARVRKVHTVLSQALRRANRDGLIRTNPAAGADLPTMDEPEIDPPSADEVIALMELAADTHPGFGVFVRLAAVSGCRRSELCALRFADLDVYPEGDGRLTVARALSPARRQSIDGLTGLTERSTKTKRIRRLALDPATVTAIGEHGNKIEHRADQAGLSLIDEPRMFTDDLTGRTPWRPDTVTDWWRKCRKTAGLEGVRLHDLRHYMTTTMMAAGVDITTGMGRGGWSNPSQFLGRYAHFRPAPDRAAAEILGDTLGGRSAG